MRLRRALGLVTLAIVAGVLYLYAAHNAGRKELRALCEQGVEPKVYRRVEAEGYFDSGISCLYLGCWDTLMDKSFRYIETERRNAKPWHRLPENGFYRFSKVRQDSGLCDPKILEEMQQAVGFRKYLTSGYCIRMEKIDKPRAPYGLFSEAGRVIKVGNIFGSSISELHTYIKDMKTDEIVVERRSYMLYQNTFRSFSSFASVLGCSDVGLPSKMPNVGTVEPYVKPI